MQTGLTLIEATHAHVVAVFHRVIITFFAYESTASWGASFRRALDFAEPRHPGELALLTIVAEGAPLPGADARAAMAEGMRLAGKRGVQRSAVYVEGDGFRAAAVRGVTTGLILVARQPYPHQVFKSFEEAVTWLVPEMGTREVLRAVGAVRESLQPHRAAR